MYTKLVCVDDLSIKLHPVVITLYVCLFKNNSGAMLVCFGLAVPMPNKKLKFPHKNCSLKSYIGAGYRHTSLKSTKMHLFFFLFISTYTLQT